MGVEFFAILSLVITAISTAISFLLKPSAPSDSGQDAQSYKLSSAGTPIPIAYGRTKVQGIIVFADEQSPRDTLGENNSTLLAWEFGVDPSQHDAFGNSLDTRKKREYQLSQHVLCVGDISGVETILVDGQTSENEDKWRAFKATYNAAGTVNDIAVLFSPERTNSAKFTHLPYITIVCHQRPLKNPQWFGYPQIDAFIKGRTLKAIELNSGVHSLSASETYRVDSISVLIDYTTSTLYGPGLVSNDFNLKSFYAAQTLARRVVQGAGNYLWNKDYPSEYNTRFGTNYSKWRDAFAAVGLTARTDTGLAGDGNSNSGHSGRTAGFTPFLPFGSIGAPPSSFTGDSQKFWKSLPNSLYRYEFNGIISTKRNFASNIDKIMNSMPGALLFIDNDGKLKIKIPDAYTTAANQSVMVLNKHNLVGNVKETIPDANQKLNRVSLIYLDASKGLEEETFTFPEAGSTFDTTILAQDNGVRLEKELKADFVPDKFHALSLAMNTILISREPLYEFETIVNTAQLELGDIVRLQDDILGVDIYVMILTWQDKLRTRTIQYTAVKFVPSNYGWLPHGAELAAPKILIPTVHPPENVVLASTTGDVRYIETTWDESSSIEDDDLVSGYEIEVTQDNGVNWRSLGVVNADAELALSVRAPDNQGTYKTRVRAFSQTNLYSDWVESSAVSLDAFSIASGMAGVSGAVIRIYKKANTKPTDKPDNAVFTFTSNTLAATGSGSLNGWTTTIPAGTNRLWARTAYAANAGSTDTILASEWSEIIEDEGKDGINAAPLFLWQRKATKPTVKPGTSTYTFSTKTHTITSTNLGDWKKTIPDGNNPLWVAFATASSDTDTDTVPSSEWSIGSVARDGGPGVSSAVVKVWKRASTKPTNKPDTATFNFAANTLTATGVGSLNGWTISIPNGTDTLWARVAHAASAGDADTINTSDWSEVVHDEGQDGINSFPLFLWQRKATKPTTKPGTSTFTFSTKIHTISSGNLNGWAKTIPNTNGNPLWVATAVAASDTNTDTVPSSEWSIGAVAKDGEDGGKLREIAVYIQTTPLRTGTSAPTKPTATSYIFSTDTLNGLTANWSRTRPGPNNRKKIYTSLVTAASISDTDTSLNFSTPILSTNPNDVDVIYRRSTTNLTKPADTGLQTVAAGWSTDPSGATGTDPLWECLRYIANSGANAFWKHKTPVQVDTEGEVFLSEPTYAAARTLTEYRPVTVPGSHAAVNVDGEWSIEKVRGRIVAADRTTFTDLNTGDDWPRYLWGVFGASSLGMRTFARSIKAGTFLLIKFDSQNFALYYIYAASAEGGVVGDSTNFSDWQWVGEIVPTSSIGVIGTLANNSDVFIGADAQRITKDEVYAAVKEIIEVDTGGTAQENEDAVVFDDINDIITISAAPSSPIPGLPVTAGPLRVSIPQEATSIGRNVRCDAVGGRKPYSYQWYRINLNGTNEVIIIGETERLYTIRQADLGKGLRCIVMDASSPTAIEQADLLIAPSDVFTVEVDHNEPIVNEEIKCVATPEGLNYSYQWIRHPDYRPIRNQVRISGATDASYIPTTADIGSTLSCEVTNGSAVRYARPYLPVRAEGYTTITARISDTTPRVGDTLTCIASGGVAGAYEYQWIRIRPSRFSNWYTLGPTTRQVTVPEDWIGYTIWCEVTSGGGKASTPSVAKVAPRSGDNDLHAVMSADTPVELQQFSIFVEGGTSPYSYQWSYGADATNIQGNTDTITVPLEATGSFLICEITDSAGNNIVIVSVNIVEDTHIGGELVVNIGDTTPIEGEVTYALVSGGPTGIWGIEWQQATSTGAWEAIDVYEYDARNDSPPVNIVSPEMLEGFKYRLKISDGNVVRFSGETHIIPNTPLSASVALDDLIYPTELLPIQPFVGNIAVVSYVGGSGTPTFQWRKDGIDIPGATTNNIYIRSDFQESIISCHITRGSENVETAFELHVLIAPEIVLAWPDRMPLHPAMGIRPILSGGTGIFSFNLNVGGFFQSDDNAKTGIDTDAQDGDAIELTVTSGETSKTATSIPLINSSIDISDSDPGGSGLRAWLVDRGISRPSIAIRGTNGIEVRVAGNSGTIQYQWQKRHPYENDWENVPNTATSSSLSTSSISTRIRSSDGEYLVLGHYVRCCVRDNGGNVAYSKATPFPVAYQHQCAFFSTNTPTVGQPIYITVYGWGGSASAQYIDLTANVTRSNTGFSRAPNIRTLSQDTNKRWNGPSLVYIPTEKDIGKFLLLSAGPYGPIITRERVQAA